jgi:hypothetical protein
LSATKVAVGIENSIEESVGVNEFFHYFEKNLRSLYRPGHPALQEKSRSLREAFNHKPWQLSCMTPHWPYADGSRFQGHPPPMSYIVIFTLIVTLANKEKNISFLFS